MGRRKKGEDDSIIRGRLVDRIGKMFFSRGLSTYTMDEISRAFRMSKRTLYRLFPTKDDMILQVAHLVTSRIGAFVERRLKRIESEGPAAFVPQVAEFFRRFGTILLAMPVHLLSDLERESPETLQPY